MEFNPLLPEVVENPYPYYKELRASHPVYPLAAGNAFAVSRYDDVMFVLKHHELFSSKALANLAEGEMLIATDPPTHTRLRNTVNRGFAPAKIEALEPRIREVTSQLINAVLKAGEFDLISDLARPAADHDHRGDAGRGPGPPGRRQALVRKHGGRPAECRLDQR